MLFRILVIQLSSLFCAVLTNSLLFLRMSHWHCSNEHVQRALRYGIVGLHNFHHCHFLIVWQHPHPDCMLQVISLRLDGLSRTVCPISFIVKQFPVKETCLVWNHLGDMKTSMTNTMLDAALPLAWPTVNLPHKSVFRVRLVMFCYSHYTVRWKHSLALAFLNTFTTYSLCSSVETDH